MLAPRGATVPSEDYVTVTSATLRDYIDAQTITVEEDIIAGEIENPNGEQTTGGNNAEANNGQVAG